MAARRASGPRVSWLENKDGLVGLAGGGHTAIIADDNGGFSIGEWDFGDDGRRRSEDRGYKRIRDIGAD